MGLLTLVLLIYAICLWYKDLIYVMTQRCYGLLIYELVALLA